MAQIAIRYRSAASSAELRSGVTAAKIQVSSDQQAK